MAQARRRGFPLFTIFGFEVKFDLSWLLLGLLITWTLAAGLFPRNYPELATATYWWMGVAGAVGILFSIVFHELAHSLVARRFGLPIGGITLFIFGGIAEMRSEPPSPKVEFLVAGVGPLSSLLLAAICWQLHQFVVGLEWSTALEGVLFYLAFINVVLAVFNLVPAFPLDGGRMLRAAFWSWRKDLESATRIASRIGAWFGIFLMVLGVVAFVGGSFIGGMWYLLIGAFLRAAARAGYQQVVTREFLGGRPVRAFMDASPPTVTTDVSLSRFVEDFLYQHHLRLFPVVEGARLVGCIGVEDVKGVPREDWDRRTVGDVMTACSRENTVRPDDDSTDLLGRMSQPGGRTAQMVVDGDRLLGIVSLEDLREIMALRLELGHRPA